MISLDALYYMMKYEHPIYVDGYYKGKEVRISGKLISYGPHKPVWDHLYIVDMDFVIQLEYDVKVSFSTRMHMYNVDKLVAFVYTCCDADEDQLFGRPVLTYYKGDKCNG